MKKQCQYWKCLLKFASFSSNSIRKQFIKSVSLIFNDERLSGLFLEIFSRFIFSCHLGEFGANCYLTQNILFEYFVSDGLSSSSTDLFLYLLVNLFNDLLNEIRWNDDEEMNFDGPLSEGYNPVFASEYEICHHYSVCYGKHLLFSLKKLREKCLRINIDETIEMIKDQCNQLIDIQREAYQNFLVRQRSTIRLNLMIEFLQVTESLDELRLEQLPEPWINH